MTQPFVVSMKIVGDGSNASAAVQAVRRDIEQLQRIAVQTAGGGLQARIDQMVGIGGNGRSTAEAAADIAAYGTALDDLRAKYNPLFALERQHEANLAGIRNAYNVGAIGADEMAAAIDREKAAHLAAVTALDQHSLAQDRNAAAMRRANAQRANLLFQLQDIGVTLAMGMNPLMVAMQQGSQISMIYGPEEGGLGKALSETGKIAAGVATRLLPVALVAGAIAAGVAGMRHEIEATTGKAVSFGDVFLAVFQVIGDRLYSVFKPQIDAIGQWFEDAWEWVKETTRDAGNFVVREIIGGTDIVVTAVQSIPDAFVVVGEAAAEGLANAIIAGLREVVIQVNSMIRGINGLAAGAGLDLKLGTLGAPDDILPWADFDFGGDEAAGRLAERWDALGGRMKELVDTDFMGDFFDDVLDHAVANFTERTRDKKAEQKLADAYRDIVRGAQDHIRSSEAERMALGMTSEAASRLRYEMELLNKARDAGIKLSPTQVRELKDLAAQMAEAEEATRILTEAYDFGKSTFRSFFQEVFGGLREGKTAWEAFADAGANALDRIAERALGMAADGIFDMIFNAVMGGISGGLGGGFSRPGSFSIGNMALYADGTPSAQSGWAVVGEEGPELVRFRGGERVYSNGDSQRLLGGGTPGIVYAPVINGAGMNAAELKAVLAADRANFAREFPALYRDAVRRAAI